MRRATRLCASAILAISGLSTARGAEGRSRLADPIATSFIYPVGNPDVAPTWDANNGNGYYITQGFNDSCDPGLGQGYYAYGLYYCGHTGIDLASDGSDSTVHATAAGVVTEAQQDGGYGVTVRIRHTLPSGSLLYSQYEHMQYGSLNVYDGQPVSQGQPLGLVGATGFANGTHLHFELKTFDAGGPGYTFGNEVEIAPFFDPLVYVAAHSAQPYVLVTATGHAIPEWPAETDAVLQRFLRHYTHFVVVSDEHGLFLRSGPGSRNRALGVALRGAHLGFIRRHGDWLYVALPQDVRGWVSKDWVSGFGYWDTHWPPRGPVALVDTVGLNVHMHPGQRHTIIGLCFVGDTISIRARTAHWTLIRSREGVDGWVLTRYLALPGVARPRGGGQMILAEAGVLNLRGGPGLEYPVVGKVFRGTGMRLVRVSPHWAAVILPGGTTGWVARSFTSLAPRPLARHSTTRRAKPAPATVRAWWTPAANRHPTVRTPKATSPLASQVRVVGVEIDIRGGPGDRHPIVARAGRRTRLQVIGSTLHWLHIALPATSIQGWVLRRDVVPA